jgi:hypothetical protein
MSEQIEMENDSVTNISKERCATREKVFLDALKSPTAITDKLCDLLKQKYNATHNLLIGISIKYSIT